MGQIAGWRRDWEAVCLLNHWQDRPESGPLASSVIETNLSITALAKDLGHPTPKPVSLMETLLGHCKPEWRILDPFAGTGSTLLAARNLGRKAIGFELDERHCEMAARRLSQQLLDFEETT
jgi:site-specific DNA-methyltransferase (adenine-specific)